jgi:hypothetical protein
MLTHVSRPNSAATRSHSIASVTFLAVPSPWLIATISGFRIGLTALCCTISPWLRVKISCPAAQSAGFDACDRKGTSLSVADGLEFRVKRARRVE